MAISKLNAGDNTVMDWGVKLQPDGLLGLCADLTIFYSFIIIRYHDTNIH